jgi:molybdopterin synthase catalytic subunit
MNLSNLIEKVKQNPDFDQVGMILGHNGVVRGTSRDGRKVSGLRVAVDHEKLANILTEYRDRSGILDVQVWINEDKDLKVGDDVMFLVVAGDIRENVISTLESSLNAIKSTVTSKTEFFV